METEEPGVLQHMVVTGDRTSITATRSPGYVIQGRASA
jgi:hypothetical protein